MIIKQADLFWGLDNDFITELMESGKKETFKKGTILFHEGEEANHFYVMLRGRVRLTIGEGDQLNYVIKHAGEAFGWSSLLEKKTYSSSVRCLEDTVLLKFEAMDVQRLAEDNPVNGMALYKKLAEALGKRLVSINNMEYFRLHTSEKESYGSRQMLDFENL
jgi:CRP-like cAMP-binding protein